MCCSSQKWHRKINREINLVIVSTTQLWRRIEKRPLKQPHSAFQKASRPSLIRNLKMANTFAITFKKTTTLLSLRRMFPCFKHHCQP